MDADTRPLVPVNFILGVLTFLAGALLLADSLGLLRAESGWTMWPLAVIVLGVAVRMQPNTASRVIGLALLVAGFWLLFNEVGIWTYSFWDTWPLVLILFGVWMLYRTDQMRQIAGGSEGYDRQSTGAENVGAFAFLAQIARKTTGQELRTGQMSAVLGDCSFDFTDARRGAGPIVVGVFALAGRIRITVPDDWVVDARVLPLLGKVADRRDDDDAGAADDDPAPADGTEAPVDLLIQGTAILGGVEVVPAE
jgi:hypothetical protein